MNFDIHKIEDIVKQAATIIKNSRFEVEYQKGFENIVTSSDLQVQHFLYEHLARLIPECGFICEENSIIDIQNKEYVWIIDPIDGTTNYARGISNYCISVALMQNKEVVLGVVYNPASNEIFSATRGNGATLNNKAINVSKRRYEQGILCTAMSLYQKRYAKLCSDIILDAYLQCNDIRRFGSCALELCYIAMGLCELYFEFRVMPWDYAAGYIILTEAGGVLTEYNGQKLTIDRPALLVGANNQANHRILMSHITKYINPNTCNYEWQIW